MDLPHLDWGSVPAWLGAGSLILAYIVFRRDRVNAERRQVDLLGAWATAKYERRVPGAPRVEECEIVGHIRNASELPIRVRQVAYRVETFWLVEDQEQSMPGGGPWTRQPGTGPRRSFQENLDTVPPGKTHNLPFTLNVADLAPPHAVQLDTFGGVTPRVDWLLVVDNAGRKWEVRPETGRRAKRVRRRWRPSEYMPRTW